MNFTQLKVDCWWMLWKTTYPDPTAQSLTFDFTYISKLIIGRLKSMCIQFWGSKLVCYLKKPFLLLIRLYRSIHYTLWAQSFTSLMAVNDWALHEYFELFNTMYLFSMLIFVVKMSLWQACRCALKRPLRHRNWCT